MKKIAVIGYMNRRDEKLRFVGLHNWRRIRDFKEHVLGHGHRHGFRRTSTRIGRHQAYVQ